MSEEKSLVAWKAWAALTLNQHHDIACILDGNYPNVSKCEFAHDLSGRFLGVFREVKK